MEGAELEDDPILCLIPPALQSYPCQYCPKAFYIPSIREAHERSAHARVEAEGTGSEAAEHTCKKCAYKGTTALSLLLHVKGIHGPQRFCCKLCDYSTNLETGVMKHMVVAHSGLQLREKTPQGKSSFSCSTCGLNFGSRYRLQRHKGAHGGERLFQCSTCGRNLSSKQNLDLHEAAHSRREGRVVTHKAAHSQRDRRVVTQKPFKCSTCGRNLSSKQNLDLHEAAHGRWERRVITQKPFKCSTCGRILSSKQSLDLHEAAHSRRERQFVTLKPFKCSTCGKRFKKKFNLKAHLVAHRREESVGCSSSAQAHLKVESQGSTDETPTDDVKPDLGSLSSCPHYRHDESLDRTELAKLLLGHSQGSAFQCEICQARFRTNTLLTRHINVNHTILGL